jgi:hypothetical protein
MVAFLGLGRCRAIKKDAAKTFQNSASCMQGSTGKATRPDSGLATVSQVSGATGLVSSPC